MPFQAAGDKGGGVTRWEYVQIAKDRKPASAKQKEAREKEERQPAAPDRTPAGHEAPSDP